MENNSELVRLEQFVDNLLARYKSLQAKYDGLETEMEKRDAECARLKETIEELRSERSEVGNRITGLIARIEQWEEEQETGEPADDDEAEEGSQGKLFNRERSAAQ